MSPIIKEAAEVAVANAKAKIAADREARLVEAKRAAHLDVVAPKAQEHADFLAGQATKVSTTLKETEFSPDDERDLTAERPGLRVWFDRRTETRQHLIAITARKQSILATALAEYEQLTPEDFLIREKEPIDLTPFGAMPSRIWGLYQRLLNTGTKDIDEAIRNAKTAFAELVERIWGQS